MKTPTPQFGLVPAVILLAQLKAVYGLRTQALGLMPIVAIAKGCFEATDTVANPLARIPPPTVVQKTAYHPVFGFAQS
jgi:hypothetical protein